MDTRTSMVAVVFAMLAGCSTSWLPWSTTPTEVGQYTPPGARAYACEGGKRLLVRYESDAKSAWVIYPDRQLRLDRVASGSGEEYARAGTTLAVKDGEAMVTEGATLQYARCKPEK